VPGAVCSALYVARSLSKLLTLAVLLLLIFLFFAYVVSNGVFGLAVTSCRSGEAEMCEYGLLMKMATIMY
jgi:hypothetical protein